MLTSIDKRTFLAGLTCPTMGWYVKQDGTEKISRGLQWRFHVGNEIAQYARQWLGDGRMLARSPTEIATGKTASALENPASTLLFEASFSWERLVARADALRHTKNGWELIEIKSGVASGEKSKDISKYLNDIAYTLCVAMGAGLDVTAVTLVLLSREYRLDEDTPMFTAIDVTKEAVECALKFQAIATDIAVAATSEEKPASSLKFVCKDCEYFDAKCVGVNVPDPLFVLPRLSKEKFDKLHEFECISRLPPDVEVTDSQRVVLDAIRSGNPHKDPKGLALLDQVTYPAYYLDFEAILPHLPWFATRPPYDPVPFQYSLHTRSAIGDGVEHCDYLAPASGDWRLELIERLISDLGTTGSIVVYSSYEKTRLKSLAELFRDFAGQLLLIIDRLFDLEKVVKEGYIHPGFQGRTSIKKVLPIVAPDLSYKSLSVGNGDDAAATFGLMRVGKIAVEDHAYERAALLDYCRMDTLAMVRLHEELVRVREEC